MPARSGATVTERAAHGDVFVSYRPRMVSQGDRSTLRPSFVCCLLLGGWLSQPQPALADRAPEPAGALVATHQGATLTVARVTPSGVAPGFTLQAPGLASYGWSDPQTLWMVRSQGKTWVAAEVQGGKEVRSVPLPGLAMITAGKDAPSGIQEVPGLVITGGREVHVTTCLRFVPGRNNTQVCETGYTRVDDGSKAFSKKRPKGVMFDWEGAPGRKAGKAKAPAGYAVKLGPVVVDSVRYGGFTCTGPKGQKTVWPVKGTTDETALDSDPRFVPVPRKVTWLSAAPALVQVSASGKTPIGEKLAAEIFVLDCARVIHAPVHLGDGLWLVDGAVINAEGKTLGKVDGEHPVLSP